MSYVIFLWKILTLRFARVLGVQRTWIRKASDRTFFALKRVRSAPFLLARPPIVRFRTRKEHDLRSCNFQPSAPLIAPPEEAASKKKTVPQKQHRLIDLISIAVSLL